MDRALQALSLVGVGGFGWTLWPQAMPRFPSYRYADRDLTGSEVTVALTLLSEGQRRLCFSDNSK